MLCNRPAATFFRQDEANSKNKTCLNDIGNKNSVYFIFSVIHEHGHGLLPRWPKWVSWPPSWITFHCTKCGFNDVANKINRRKLPSGDYVTISKCFKCDSENLLFQTQQQNIFGPQRPKIAPVTHTACSCFHGVHITDLLFSEHLKHLLVHWFPFYKNDIKIGNLIYGDFIQA